MTASGEDPGAVGAAVVELLGEAEQVSAGNPGARGSLARRLEALLGDVAITRDPHIPTPSCVPEERLAACLGELYRSHWWEAYRINDPDAATRQAFAERAVVIYTVTSAWLSDPEAEWLGPAAGAVGAMRQIADGYALLAIRWIAGVRSRLPFPDKEAVSSALADLGVQRWAAQYGHHVDLFDQSGDQANVGIGQPVVEADDEMISGAFAASLCRYELLRTLCASYRGRRVLQTDNLRRLAGVYLAQARFAARWGWIHRPTASGVTAAQVLIAEGYFVATHGALTPVAEVFPNQSTLSKVLTAEDRTWLRDLRVEIPNWLVDGTL